MTVCASLLTAALAAKNAPQAPLAQKNPSFILRANSSFEFPGTFENDGRSVAGPFNRLKPKWGLGLSFEDLAFDKGGNPAKDDTITFFQRGSIWLNFNSNSSEVLDQGVTTLSANFKLRESEFFGLAFPIETSATYSTDEGKDVKSVEGALTFSPLKFEDMGDLKFSVPVKVTWLERFGNGLNATDSRSQLLFTPTFEATYKPGWLRFWGISGSIKSSYALTRSSQEINGQREFGLFVASLAFERSLIERRGATSGLDLKHSLQLKYTNGRSSPNFDPGSKITFSYGVTASF